MVSVFLYIRDEVQRKQLRNDLAIMARRLGCEMRISDTSNLTVALDFTQKKQQSNILLLDFAQPKEGYQLAHCLRQLDPLPAWIMVNGNLESLHQSLCLRPSGYLALSTDEKRLEKILRNILREYANYLKTTQFSFKFHGEIIRVPFSDIQYLESHGKKVSLHFYKDKHQYEFASKLEDVLALFPSTFLRCHQSYAVNTDFIKSFHIKTQTFVLISGAIVPISRRMFKEVQAKYTKT